MDFTGKICPYCKTAFREGDDIVVCSVCEMPHHKECWIENKACTTFGCTGTIQGIDQAPEEETAATRCTSCGAALEAGQKFCGFCGQPNGIIQQQSSPLPSGALPETLASNAGTGSNDSGFSWDRASNDSDVRDFLRSYQEFYLQKFSKMEKNHSEVSWNWNVFLVGPYWFAYRKMYAITGLYLVLDLLFQCIPDIGLLLRIVLKLVMCLRGNYYYKRYVQREVSAAKQMAGDEKAAYLKKKGGTSIPAVFVTFAAMIGLTLLILMLLTGID